MSAAVRGCVAVMNAGVMTNGKRSALDKIWA